MPDEVDGPSGGVDAGIGEFGGGDNMLGKIGEGGIVGVVESEAVTIDSRSEFLRKWALDDRCGMEDTGDLGAVGE